MKKWFLSLLLPALIFFTACSTTNIHSSETNSTLNIEDTPTMSPTNSTIETVKPEPTSLPSPTPELAPSQTPQSNSIDNTQSNDYNAIIIAFGNNGEVQRGILLGCSKDETWLTQEDLELPDKFTYNSPMDLEYFNEEELFKFYSCKQLVASEKVAKPRIIAIYNGTTIIDLAFEPFLLDEMCVIGITGNWNALPRAINRLDNSSFTVDINNDSKEEYCNLDKTPNSKYPNHYDYTLRIGNGDEIITEAVLLKSISLYDQYDVFIMDVNGDGILEIISTYRGSSYLGADIYEYKNNSINRVLSTYVGD